MDFTAVYTEKRIPRFSPVYSVEKTAANPMYRHLPHTTSDSTEAQKDANDKPVVLGLAVSNIDAYSMGSVIVNGLTRIQLRSSSGVKKVSQWIVAADNDAVKVAQIVHVNKTFDADGEADEFVVAVMPWVNYLQMKLVNPKPNVDFAAAEFANEVVGEMKTAQANGKAYDEETLKALFIKEFATHCNTVLETCQKQIL